MRLCEYCGVTNEDDAVKCSSCSGSSFQNKCNQCATVFSEGNFCPKCGVKAGTKAKNCPNCQKEHYSLACPDCGHRPDKADDPTIILVRSRGQSQSPSKSRKKKNTWLREPKNWLWILGWLFVFPVPLMLLLNKNKKMPQWQKITLIVGAWLLYAVLLYIGKTQSDQEKAEKARQSQKVATYATVERSLIIL